MGRMRVTPHVQFRRQVVLVRERHLVRLLVQPLEVVLEGLRIPSFGDPIHPGRFRPIARREACLQVVPRNMVPRRRVRRG
jgi:hypothetical protein